MLKESLFLKACRREPVSRTPIWLMRQAGRYMPEYRAVRARHSFLELCKNPELAAEVAIHAARVLDVDAAILFSDILLILEPMGARLEYASGDGPVIHNPIGSLRDVEALRVAPPESLDFVYQAVRHTREGLPPGLPLIGFCGAPFTLASYLIEGGSADDFERTKSFMRSEPQAWNMLMEKLTGGLVSYLRGQVEAGVQAVQIFDSWIGCLSADDYRAHVQPAMRSLFAQLPSDIPVIHFGTRTEPLLEAMREAGGTVMSVDWRVPLDTAWHRIGALAIQGNLDPHILFDDIPTIQKEARRILAQAGKRPGHIFNLGHGVLPDTPVDHVKALVDFVHAQ